MVLSPEFSSSFWALMECDNYGATFLGWLDLRLPSWWPKYWFRWFIAGCWLLETGHNIRVYGFVQRFGWMCYKEGRVFHATSLFMDLLVPSSQDPQPRYGRIHVGDQRNRIATWSFHSSLRIENLGLCSMNWGGGGIMYWMILCFWILVQT